MGPTVSFLIFSLSQNILPPPGAVGVSAFLSGHASNELSGGVQGVDGRGGGLRICHVFQGKKQVGHCSSATMYHTAHTHTNTPTHTPYNNTIKSSFNLHLDGCSTGTDTAVEVGWRREEEMNH